MRIKNHLFIALLILLFTTEKAHAEVLHWPELCSSGTLQLKNNGSAALSVWLQKFDTNLISETEYELTPNSELSIPVDKLPEERFSLLEFSPDKKIEASYTCGKTSYAASSLEGGVLSFKKTDLNQIWLQNLYTDSNSIQIEFQNFSFQTISTETLQLKSLESLLFNIPDTIKNWSYFKISSSNRLASFNLSSSGASGPLLIKTQQTEVDSSAAYFIVSARTGASDSFIVQIKDQKMADRARDLIKNPQQEKMLFAKIQKNHQGFNRNWSSPQKNLWSWSTTEVTNFADLGSTACNGQPQQLEDRMDAWIADPGQICFWNYRVKKELTPLEVSTGALQDKLN